MNQLAISNQSRAIMQSGTMSFTVEQIDLIKRTICKNATDDELALFMGQCNRLGLDPFAKQIHAVKRWDSQERREVMAIQVGIDGFRIAADRHRNADGERDYAGQVGPYWCGKDGIWRDIWLSDEPPQAAKVGALRKGCQEPFWGVALYRSYVQKTKDGAPTKFWRDMPEAQLAKCAESLALRKAFPNDLSGIYSPEEMAQADNPRPTGKEVQQAPQTQQPDPAQALAELRAEIAQIMSTCEDAELTEAIKADWQAARTMDEKQAVITKARQAVGA